MNEDRILEFMATVGGYMRDTDRRFEQLITVMHDGFGRLTDQMSALTQEVRHTNQRLDRLIERVDYLTERVDHLTERVDHLTERVDHLTERVDLLTVEVAELKADMHQVKNDISNINRRLSATFDQTGRLTEQTDATGMRLTYVEGSLQPTNAELDQRLREVETTLRKLAS